MVQCWEFPGIFWFVQSSQNKQSHMRLCWIFPLSYARLFDGCFATEKHWKEFILLLGTELPTSHSCCSFLFLCFKMGTINILDLGCLISSPLSLHSGIAWLPQGSVLMKVSKICFSGVTSTWSNFPHIFAIPRDIQRLKLFSVNSLEVVSVCRSSYLLNVQSEWDCISHHWEDSKTLHGSRS